MQGLFQRKEEGRVPTPFLHTKGIPMKYEPRGALPLGGGHVPTSKKDKVYDGFD